MAKWLCTGGSLAVLILFVVTLRWKLDWTSADLDRRIVVSRGAAVIRDGRGLSTFKGRVDDINAQLAQLGESELEDLQRRMNLALQQILGVFNDLDQWAIGVARWRPVLYSSSGSLRVGIPLYVPFLVFSIPAILIWRADLRRIPPNHCRTCGYNLTGNVSGVCPECGEGIA